MDHRGTERRSACWMFVVLLSCVSSSWNSAVAGEDAGGQALIGTPTSVAIGPESPPLRGRHSTRQMIATGRYADGSVRDLTRLLFWTSLDPAVATVSDRGQVFPRGNGTATIVARHRSIESSAVVKVQQMDQPAPVSFRRDVIPAFSQSGCNTGACHGTPTGKGGFRLSLRGCLPDQDYLTLSRDAGGRRINIMAAESSLLLTNERNMPMDRFVRMLLTTDGSTYSNPATNYQLSSHTNELNADDNLYFSHALTKLLPAEVLLDAISTVTGTTTAFEGLPQGSRATQMPDGKMDNPFLKTFGRPARELACECERESDSNLSQALQLIGGATVNGKLHDDNGRIAQLAKSGKSPEAITRDLYLVALGRTPTAAELAAATKHLKAGTDLRAAVEDLGWVLINSKEFLFRH